MIFSDSLQRKNARAKVFSVLCSSKCGIIFTRFHAFVFSSSMILCGGKSRVNDCISVMRDVSRASLELRRSESKKAKLEELSNNISERRCELKANERAAILSNALVRSRHTSYWCIRNIVYY